MKHPDFELFVLGFVRENQQVTQAFHGADWYLGAKYNGPKTFRNEERLGSVSSGTTTTTVAWYGDTRVVLRKGQLFMDGVQPLVPRGDGKFGIGDPEGPDWISFESIVDGRAMRLNFSGNRLPPRVYTVARSSRLNSQICPSESDCNLLVYLHQQRLNPVRMDHLLTR